MPLGEFELIDRYFRPLSHTDGVARAGLVLGIGDDGAILRPPAGQDLVLVLDTLVSGRHFLTDADPRSIGHRALAVNLSDLAAMGAQPAWALLGLSLPSADASFLEGFAAGWQALAQLYEVALIGGDTTSGPLCASVQLTGLVPQGSALRRSGGSAGDSLYVSGTVGDSAAGLALLQSKLEAVGDARATLIARHEYPTPRVALGSALRGIASACVDVSDGLAADASRLAAASGCGLELDVELLPLSPALRHVAGASASDFALQGGEDFELLFAVPREREAALAAAASALGRSASAITRIGRLDAEPGLRLRSAGRVRSAEPRGYDHFLR